MATKSTDKALSRYVQGGDTINYQSRLGWWERKIFEPEDDDIVITLAPQYNIRPDLLAFDLYGSAALVWLVLQYNNIVDINEEFVSGATIQLPSPSRVTLVLLNNSAGGIDPDES